MADDDKPQQYPHVHWLREGLEGVKGDVRGLHQDVTTLRTELRVMGEHVSTIEQVQGAGLRRVEAAHADIRGEIKDLAAKVDDGQKETRSIFTRLAMIVVTAVILALIGFIAKGGLVVK